MGNTLKDPEKQIEEMAVELGVYACKKTTCRNCAVDYNCIWRESATRLYEAGYRKASEVAEEIFAEIEKEYGNQSGADRGDDLTYGQVQDFLAELKKKYTESEDTE